MPDEADISFKVSFGGGAEQLFDNKRQLSISLPGTYKSASGSEKPLDIRCLIEHMKSRLSDPKRVDLFAQGETVRPGILILVNDVDWELEGELDYAIQPGDDILFISTLHGG